MKGFHSKDNNPKDRATLGDKGQDQTPPLLLSRPPTAEVEPPEEVPAESLERKYPWWWPLLSMEPPRTFEPQWSKMRLERLKQTIRRTRELDQ